MRVAPCGLFYADQPDIACLAAVKAAALTHGHPTGYTAAGTLAYMIALIVNGLSIRSAAEAAMLLAPAISDNTETAEAIEMALFYAEQDTYPLNAINVLGEGWTAEEALAIGLYCALKGKTAKDALLLAVNHKGDSDSTGAICGNIVGAFYGYDALPADWIKTLELEGFIRVTAFELYKNSGIKRKEYEDAEK